MTPQDESYASRHCVFRNILKPLLHEAVVAEVRVGVVGNDGEEDDHGQAQKISRLDCHVERRVVIDAHCALHPVDNALCALAWWTCAPDEYSRLAGRHFEIVYVAPPQYAGMAARAVTQLDMAPVTEQGDLVIVQIHPRERRELEALQTRRLRRYDERRYGSTVLVFYEDAGEQGDASDVSDVSDADDEASVADRQAETEAAIDGQQPHGSSRGLASTPRGATP